MEGGNEFWAGTPVESKGGAEDETNTYWVCKVITESRYRERLALDPNFSVGTSHNPWFQCSTMEEIEKELE